MGPSIVADILRSEAELQQLLARDPLFSTLAAEVLRELVEVSELVDVSGGTRLLRAGDTLEAVLVVVHGSLRVVGADNDGDLVVREFYRGDTVGVMGILNERPSPVDVYAVRDCTVLRLGRAAFLAVAVRHPSLPLALARLVGERAVDVLEMQVGRGARGTTSSTGNLALVPLSPGDAIRDVTAMLSSAIDSERSTTHVSAARVDAALGAGAVTDGTMNGRLTAWLSNLEQNADLVLYECDPRLPGWTARCVRQSDRVVVVATADHARDADIRSALAVVAQPSGLARPIELVLVHPPGTRLPSGTRRWLGVPQLRAIHHVRHRGDVARVARSLVGRPSGLVLSGGGARGIAHVGVIAAIVEAGIPIDYVCGTSMGALFAAAVALDLDVDHIRTEVGELFDKAFALYDLTLPISSLLAGKKLDRVLRRQLGEADIEDLWVPFFCVSTDLSHAEMIVHERGCLWRSVRASCSIPGIFPPLPMDGRTLVDGALVDNLPIDLMIERCNGPIIAVDVAPYGDPIFEQPRSAVARWLRALRTRIRGEPASPPLFDILMRSTSVGSKVRQKVAFASEADILYLEPPVADFGPLQWRAHAELFGAGYHCAVAELTRQRVHFPRP